MQSFQPHGSRTICMQWARPLGHWQCRLAAVGAVNEVRSSQGQEPILRGLWHSTATTSTLETECLYLLGESSRLRSVNLIIISSEALGGTRSTRAKSALHRHTAFRLTGEERSGQAKQTSAHKVLFTAGKKREAVCEWGASCEHFY